ncbi:hypothetical protein EGW08_022093 [Elysia chlorotica]|uniref:RNase H type-1 domain-containing protein n=1 Tax=Elysia chlorotica TaxID=188477 RepID=A0A433SLX8_ELYCH|nr:hypothetical protein EGW08_022093 [Elysia chlorotica]
MTPVSAGHIILTPTQAVRNATARIRTRDLLRRKPMFYPWATAPLGWSRTLMTSGIQFLSKTLNMRRRTAKFVPRLLTAEKKATKTKSRRMQESTRSSSSITWIFCPGHAGVTGNERADKLAGNATVNGTLRLDKQEVLKALSEHLRNAEDTAAEDQQAIKRMIELGVRKGEGRGRQLVGKDRRVHNQVLTGTVSLDTLRCVLQRGAEHLWGCPLCKDAVPYDK